MHYKMPNNTYTSDGKARYKSRYCVRCNAIYSWQCKCPNNIKHNNVMEKFRKMSMVSVEEAINETMDNQDKDI